MPENPILLELHAHAGQLESISIHFNGRDYLLRADHSRDLSCTSEHDGSDEVEVESQVRGSIPEQGF